MWSLPSAGQTVRLSTTEGDIDIALHADAAPLSVANFLSYVRSGFFKGIIFHRVVDGFMIQTGGYGPDLKDRKTRAPIRLESDNGLNNVRGSVAMARTADPHSATSQFFINVVDNPFLDKANARDGNGYAVFGTVVAGMDVVDRIKAVPTQSKPPHNHLPLQAITIRQADILSNNAIEIPK